MMRHVRVVFFVVVVCAGVALASRQAQALVFSDSLQGLNASNWTVLNSGPFTVTSSTAAPGATFAYTGGAISSLEDTGLQLNLQAATGLTQITGDFTFSVDFSNLVLPAPPSGAGDCISLDSYYGGNPYPSQPANGYNLNVARSNQSGSQNVYG